MANAIIFAGEHIWYARWETDQYVEYDAICRVSPSENYADCNLSWFNDGVEAQSNNVKNIESLTLGATEAYYRRKYSRIIFPEGESFLWTFRVDKGDMCLYRKWDDSSRWYDIYFASVIATLGAPSDQHPAINLRYIDKTGTSQLVPALDPIESYGSIPLAEGNDLWSNIPAISDMT